MKKRIITIFIILALVCAAGGCGSSVTNVDAEIEKLTKAEDNIYYNPDKKYEKIVNTMLYQAQHTELKGSVMVANDEDVIFAAGKGLNDVSGEEVTPYSTYEIGSITKSITAVCIMKMVEKNRLTLDTTLKELYPEYSYCPNFEEVGKITIGNMLHMRSGIPDYLNEPDEFFAPDVISEICDDTFMTLSSGERLRYFFSIIDEKTFLESLFSVELTSEPDTEYAYCNTNYYLFSMILEKLMGKAYEDIVKEEIFEPCHMDDSSAMTEGDVTASILPDAWYFLPSYSKGTGDIHSSVVDMLKFCRSLFGGLLLNETSMKELLTPIDGYACGWFVDGDVYSHDGATAAFCTQNYVIDRDGQRLYVMMFSNPKDNRGDTFLSYLKELL